MKTVTVFLLLFLPFQNSIENISSSYIINSQEEDAKSYIRGDWVLPKPQSPCGVNHEYYYFNSHGSKRIRIFYKQTLYKGSVKVGSEDRVAYAPAKGKDFVGCGGSHSGYTAKYEIQSAEFVK